MLTTLCTDSKCFKPELCVNWVSCFFSAVRGREMIQANNPSSHVTVRLVYLAENLCLSSMCKILIRERNSCNWGKTSAFRE